MSDSPLPILKEKIKHIPELDGLRGILAWWVVIAHVLIICKISADQLPRGVRILLHGDYAVYGFIMLSGFVIFKLLSESRETYKVFITRRFFRLYPAYLVCLLSAMLLRPFLWSHGPVPPYLMQCELSDLSNEIMYLPWHLVAHLSLLHGAIPNSVLPFTSFALLGPAWSLSLEWQFYLVAPLLLVFLNRFRSWGMLLFVLTAAILRFLTGNNMDFGFLPCHLVPFCIGILSYQMMTTGVFRKIGDLMIAGLAPLILSFTLNLPLTIWCVVMGAAASPEESRMAGIVRRFLNSSWLQRAGQLSYSIYLGHMCIIWALLRVIYHFWPGIGNHQLLAILVPATAVATHFMAVLMYRFVEVPGIRLGRRLTGKPHVENLCASSTPQIPLPILTSHPASGEIISTNRS